MYIEPNLADELISAIKRGNPMHGRVVDQAFAALDERERSVFRRYIAYCIEAGFSLEMLARAYNLCVIDTFKEELYFKRHGKYRHSSYEEVAQAVYLNRDYMRDYMHGLAVTEFLWQNHAMIRRFFDRCLVKAPGGERYLEIGPGHGFFFAHAAKSGKWRSHHGVDISPTSLEMTRSFLQSGLLGTISNYELFENDFLRQDFPMRYNAVVMGEVLEHVENPQAFLRKIFAVSGDDPFVFLTTCINAPAIDHIFNFETIENLEGMFSGADFVVVDSLLVPYPGKTVAQSLADKLSVNVAYLLGKKKNE